MLSNGAEKVLRVVWLYASSIVKIAKMSGVGVSSAMQRDTRLPLFRRTSVQLLSWAWAGICVRWEGGARLRPCGDGKIYFNMLLGADFVRALSTAECRDVAADNPAAVAEFVDLALVDSGRWSRRQRGQDDRRRRRRRWEKWGGGLSRHLTHFPEIFQRHFCFSWRFM